MEIPLPPLEEQRRIVAEIEGCRKVLDGARQILAGYRAQIPDQQEWPVVELREAIEGKPKNGYSGKPVQHATKLKVLTLRFAHLANEAVASDDVLRDALEAEDWPAVEERIRRLLFEKPEEFWNLPKLQEIYKTDRTPRLREILAKIFGIVPAIASRSDLADEAFEKFVTTKDASAIHSRELRTVFVAFLLDPVSRKLVEQGKFPDLRARDASLYGALSAPYVSKRETLVHYLQTEVLSQ